MVSGLSRSRTVGCLYKIEKQEPEDEKKRKEKEQNASETIVNIMNEHPEPAEPIQDGSMSVQKLVTGSKSIYLTQTSRNCIH